MVVVSQGCSHLLPPPSLLPGLIHYVREQAVQCRADASLRVESNNIISVVFFVVVVVTS